MIDADHHEVELERWLQAEPDDKEREQEALDRGGYDYPVPAEERG